MARTNIRGKQIKDGSVQRADLDVVTSGQAIARKIVQGIGINITSTGVDSGTGDVTVNLAGFDTFSTKSSLDDADLFILEDSADSFDKKAITAANLANAIASGAFVDLSSAQDIDGIKTFIANQKNKTHSNFAGSEAQKFTAALQTTDASTQTLLSIPVSANSLGAFSIKIAARRKDGTDKYYWSSITGAVRRSASNSGNATLVDVPAILYGDAGSPGYVSSVDVNSTNLRIRVQGEASQNVVWAATIEYQEILSDT